MRKHVILFLFIFIYFTGFNQTININPDPNGPPWIVGPQPEITQVYLDGIDDLQMSPEALAVTLPDSYDNSQLPINFIPPSTFQDYNSCAQVAGVYYTFSYEINRLRGVPGQLEEHRYPSLFTYNFLNEGDGDNGSSTTDGWDIIKDNGVPNVNNYISNSDDTKWMTGFDNYLQGTRNRVINYSDLLFQDIIERNISLINQPQGMYYVMIIHNNAVQETKKVIKM